jgi:hypothetical protein
MAIQLSHHFGPLHSIDASGKLHASAALYPEERVSGHPLRMKLGGPQVRSGR